jgi:hypothetical protein
MSGGEEVMFLTTTEQHLLWCVCGNTSPQVGIFFSKNVMEKRQYDM